MTDLPSGIVEAKNRAERELLQRPGVVGVGVGYVELDGRLTDTVAIKVFVDPERVGRVDLPEVIERHPVNVVPRRVVLQGAPADAEAEVLGSDGASYDPLVGGISIGPTRPVGGDRYASGTLGVMVIDNQSRRPMLLSCQHVLAMQGWPLR